MLLTYGGSQVERFKEALTAGTKIVCIRPSDVLTLDLDGRFIDHAAYREFHTSPYFKHGRSNPDGKPTRIKDLMTVSVSGNRHVYIPLRAKMDLQLYHDWAVKLGSDPERERFSLERHLKSEAMWAEFTSANVENAHLQIDCHPWVLFETPAQYEGVRKWYQECGFQFSSVSYIDPETNTYDVDRE